MKIRAVELVGNNPITKHQNALANPKRKPGSIEELPWSEEILAIFTSEFNLTLRDLKALGAQPIFHHPTKKVLKEAAATDEVTLSRGSTDPFDHQWYSIYGGPWNSEVPYKYSIRVPMLDKDNQVIDHQYYQLVPHHDGHGHTVQRYRFGEEAPQVGFPLWSNKSINNAGCEIYVTDCPFLATQLVEPNVDGHGDPVVIVANGVLESGYSKGYFRFNDARYCNDQSSSISPDAYTGRDAFEIVTHLGLDKISLAGRHITFFLEGDWMHRPTLDGSMAMLKQAISLRDYIKFHGGKALFVTPPEINPDNGPIDFAHLVATNGLSSSEDYWMDEGAFPGFDYID